VGPPWARPPTDSSWIGHTSWGFGIFEFLQFAELANIYPVLCVNFNEDVQGLLEYMYGDPRATNGGQQRAADGRPSPYSRNVTFICSNEEPQQDSNRDFHVYISAWNKWIAAFRTAAKTLDVWPLTVGVAMDSGAGRRWAPGNEDKFAGGTTEMLQAIFDANLTDTSV
jgi:alpha-L-arabinofuranosidase